MSRIRVKVLMSVEVEMTVPQILDNHGYVTMMRNEPEWAADAIKLRLGCGVEDARWKKAIQCRIEDYTLDKVSED